MRILKIGDRNEAIFAGVVFQQIAVIHIEQPQFQDGGFLGERFFNAWVALQIFRALQNDLFFGVPEKIDGYEIKAPDGVPAGAAGLFGYLGYDMIRLVERLPNINPDPLGLPDGWVGISGPQAAAVVNRANGIFTGRTVPGWTPQAVLSTSDHGSDRKSVV